MAAAELERAGWRKLLAPSISVIVSVYNRFELTKRAVTSVLTQTLPASEVIIVDDGSFDGTSELLRQCVAEDPAWRERVRYLHQRNQGQSAARNHGIAQAKGEWLAFIDNDDLWLPQKLEWQFRALDQFKDQCDACITDAWFMNNPSMKMTLFELAGKRHDERIGMIEDARKYLLDRRTFGHVPSIWVQNLVVRTNLARRLGGFDADLRYTEDADFAFRLACETNLCFVNMPMVLIDRTPPEERHIGESRKWDMVDFRLSMTQRRLEKRLRMIESAPRELQEATRRELSAVHSEWANWFLHQEQYGDAKKAIAKAVQVHLSSKIAMKWALIRCAPRLATKIVSRREENRNRRTFGIA
jgi:glycosyltransferase involved in cell wall biosynthesis